MVIATKEVNGDDYLRLLKLYNFEKSKIRREQFLEVCDIAEYDTRIYQRFVSLLKDNEILEVVPDMKNLRRTYYMINLKLLDKFILEHEILLLTEEYLKTRSKLLGISFVITR